MHREIIKVFCCDYCNKVSRNNAAIARHEKFCKNNSVTKALCFRCKYLIKAEEDDTSVLRRYKLGTTDVKVRAFKCEVLSKLSPNTVLVNGGKRTKNELKAITSPTTVLEIKESAYGTAWYAKEDKEVCRIMPSIKEGCTMFEKDEISRCL